MEPEVIELPSGWEISVLTNGKPMKLYRIVKTGNKTDATIICQHGQTFAININRTAGNFDPRAEDERLSAHRRTIVTVDGEWMGTRLHRSRSVATLESGKQVSLTEVRHFVFDIPEVVETSSDQYHNINAAGTITVKIEGVLVGEPIEYLPTDHGKSIRLSEEKKKTGLISSLVKLTDKVYDPSAALTPYLDFTQTEYDKSHPFWTVTFRYHTQAMFDALYTHKETKVDVPARGRDANDPIEIDDKEEVIDVDEFSDAGDRETRTPSQPAAIALRPSKDDKPSSKAIRKTMREISYRAARMAIRPRKTTRKVRRNVKREATAEQEIKQEHELTLEERRAAEKELADVLRRISRTDGNFVKLEADV